VLVATRKTPRGPEVDHDDFAAKSGQLYRVADSPVERRLAGCEDGKRELRRGFPGKR
jgi:hypothetical protein